MDGSGVDMDNVISVASTNYLLLPCVRDDSQELATPERIATGPFQSSPDLPESRAHSGNIRNGKSDFHAAEAGGQAHAFQGLPVGPPPVGRIAIQLGGRIEFGKLEALIT